MSFHRSRRSLALHGGHSTEVARRRLGAKKAMGEEVNGCAVCAAGSCLLDLIFWGKDVGIALTSADAEFWCLLVLGF